MATLRREQTTIGVAGLAAVTTGATAVLVGFASGQVTTPHLLGAAPSLGRFGTTSPLLVGPGPEATHHGTTPAPPHPPAPQPPVTDRIVGAPTGGLSAELPVYRWPAPAPAHPVRPAPHRQSSPDTSIRWVSMGPSIRWTPMGPIHESGKHGDDRASKHKKKEQKKADRPHRARSAQARPAPARLQPKVQAKTAAQQRDRDERRTDRDRARLRDRDRDHRQQHRDQDRDRDRHHRDRDCGKHPHRAAIARHADTAAPVAVHVLTTRVGTGHATARATATVRSHGGGVTVRVTTGGSKAGAPTITGHGKHPTAQAVRRAGKLLSAATKALQKHRHLQHRHR